MILAGLLAAAVLNYSFRHGRLSVHPTFDDIGYMASGMERVEQFYEGGMRNVIRYYIQGPPHSPYSEMLAFAAFLLFGAADWAPYIANVPLAFCFFLAANHWLAGLKRWQRVLCLVLLGGVPFMAMSIHEFRPDHAVALATAAGIFAALGAPFLRSNRRHKLAIGALFGLAMLFKPPVFPQTIVLFAASLVLATLCDCLIARERVDMRRILLAWLTCLIPFVLIPLPHYWVNWHNIIAYIHEILYGHYKDSYRLHAGLKDHLLYYFTGRGGQIMLGRHLLLLLGIVGVAAVVVLARRRRAEIIRGCTIWTAVTLSAAIAVVNMTKSEYFGLTFDILLALWAVYSLALMLRIEAQSSRRLPWASAVLPIATVIGLVFFQWPPRYGSFSADWVINRNDIAYGIYHSIFDHTIQPVYEGVPASALLPANNRLISNRPRVIFTAVGDLGPPLFEYMSIRDLHPAIWSQPVITDNVEDYLAQLPNADYVVAAEQGSGLIGDFLPGYSIQDKLLATLRARHDFREIGRFPFIRNGKGFVLFQRSDFSGWEPTSGFGKFEGPFKKSEFHSVIWGMGPSSTLKIPAAADGVYRVYWEAQTLVPKVTLSLKLDGIPLGQINMKAENGFTPAVLNLRMGKGEHQLLIDYSEWDRHTERPMAVLFQVLRVEPPAPDAQGRDAGRAAAAR